MIKRICCACKIEKTIKDFFRDRYDKIGYSRICKLCNSEKNKIYYRRNSEKIKKKKKEYFKTEKGKDVIKRHVYNYTEKYPQRKKAGNILCNAVYSGKIDRLPCEVCQSTKNVDGHHDDYSKPLDVTWLCRPCHIALHNKKAAEVG